MNLPAAQFSTNIVLVAGNLGSGKTTLAEKLAERLGWNLVAEAVADNPYLAEFYGDMRSWSFHLQVYFLGLRAERHHVAANLPRTCILDRSIYEDANVFARALCALGHISSRDYHTYMRLFRQIERTLERPDLILYLTAPADLLLERIAERHLPFDQGLSLEYLKLIGSFYEDWINTIEGAAVVRIDTTKYNYVDRLEDLEQIVQHILTRLRPRYRE